MKKSSNHRNNASRSALLFVHFGFAHIIFNMLALYYFERLNESSFTGAKFLARYFAFGLLGSVMSLVLLPAPTISGVARQG
jgi:membrane associated rhomboid family serine protease